MNTTQQIGGAICTALLNSLANAAAATYLATHLTDPLVQANAAMRSYATAFWWSAGFFAVGAVVAALLFRRKGMGGSVVPAPAAVAARPLAAST
jgi:formate-dependent nitrite reductase membrane component NrfD